MKQLLKMKALLILAIAFLSLMLFSGCEKKNATKDSCQGYTGKLDNSKSVSLAAKCHFIPKEIISEWTKRYTDSRQRTNRDEAKDSSAEAQAQTNFLRAGVVSFNSCIIRKLIGDPNSIGLRALLGLDEKNVVHLIFVGINKDYGDLYVDESAECCPGGSAEKTKDGVMGPRTGGAEYGQIP